MACWRRTEWGGRGVSVHKTGPSPSAGVCGEEGVAEREGVALASHGTSRSPSTGVCEEGARVCVGVCNHYATPLDAC